MDSAGRSVSGSADWFPLTIVRGGTVTLWRSACDVKRECGKGGVGGRGPEESMSEYDVWLERLF